MSRTVRMGASPFLDPWLLGTLLVGSQLEGGGSEGGRELARGPAGVRGREKGVVLIESEPKNLALASKTTRH